MNQGMSFAKAERKRRKFKMAEMGPSGSGKTYTALTIATGLARGGKIALIDTEQSSASLYADKFEFDTLDLLETSADNYVRAIKAAIDAGYAVVVIDSLSHAWEALLEEHDAVTARSKSKNSFESWKEVTPIYKKLIRAIVEAPIHIIATMRVKTDYVMEEYTTHDGKKRTRPTKVGLAPIFRQGGEYEFDVIANIDLEHNFIVEKSRIDFLADKVIKKPGSDIGVKIAEWLDSGKAETADEYKLQSEKSKYRGYPLTRIFGEDPGYLPAAIERHADMLTDNDKTQISEFLRARGNGVGNVQAQG